MKSCWRIFVAAAALLFSASAFAGRSCEEKPPTTAAVLRGLELAQKTREALDASGDYVVVLARAGQDLTKWNLRYSHLGFAYRDAEGWRVVHKLNQCGTAEAALYRQGLGEFFLDDPWRYEAAWVVPTRDVQDKLLPLLRDNTQVATLHVKPYSIVAYAWGLRYQQSNQWAIETLAMAMQPQVPATRANEQAWLQSQGYQPTNLHIDAFTRLGGRLAKANVAFDDHPPEKRFTDRIETVTVDSVFEWLQRSGLGSTPATVRVESHAS